MNKFSQTNKIKSFFELFRPFTSFLISFAVLVSAFIAAGPKAFTMPSVLIAIFSVFLFGSAANALNDYFDREIDKKNHPERPLPSGRITEKEALNVSILMFLISVSVSIYINLTCFIITIAAFLIQVMYEFKFKKKFMGNFVIGFLTALLFIFGSAATGETNIQDISNTSNILALLAFLSISGREIIKAIEDISGDSGRRFTLPMKIGVKKAGFIASLLLISAVILSPIPYIFNNLNLIYLVFIIPADLIFIHSLSYLFEDPKKTRKRIKIAMLLSLIAFLLGKLFS